jgi:hypothetical protein
MAIVTERALNPDRPTDYTPNEARQDVSVIMHVIEFAAVHSVAWRWREEGGDR